jgi:hypothetical protein
MLPSFQAGGPADKPVCTRFVGGTRVCSVPVPTGEAFVSGYLPHLSLLGAGASDIFAVSFGTG